MPDHQTELIATIAVGLSAAFVGGFIASRLRLPTIVGYLLAGIAVGPFTPGFVADQDIRAAARRDRRDPADVRCACTALGIVRALGGPPPSAGPSRSVWRRS